MAKVNKKKVAVGMSLGLAAAAAAGAGYYFYGSKHAGANRKKAAKWTADLEADVVKAAKKLKKLDQKAYATIVDEASKAYGSMTSVSARDLDAAARELKQNWKNVERELSRTMKSKGTAAKKAVKKTAKKVVKAVKKATAKKAAKKAPAKKKKAVTKKKKA
jgi:MetJ family transcriptional regulator, methionine regulon repressor